jgi:Domain of unknown function (DUF3859)
MGQTGVMKQLVHQMFRAFALCGTLLWAVPVWAQSIDQLGPLMSSFRAGIFCAPKVINTTPAPDTVAGVTNIIEDVPPFVSAGRNVPAVLGMGFGILSSSKQQMLLDVLVVVTHPPMGDAGVTRQSYYTEVTNIGESMTLYQFDFAYELVEGPWTITAMQGDELLFRAGFTVVPPGQVPELAGVCGYEDLLS